MDFFSQLFFKKKKFMCKNELFKVQRHTKKKKKNHAKFRDEKKKVYPFFLNK